MSEKEILSLHKLNYVEQWNWLSDNHVLRLGDWHSESFSDCAFRMRDETDNFEVGLWKIYRATTGEERNIPTYFLYEWLAKAEPIRWIQASLLAKKES